ncbi:accessory gene regulator B family protein [Paenibacillus humicola]|uniref:accessory gene regulator B family protein n=1 Tax=Paenibacillus humicola TaxID=3110540 RepID=UPI00237C2423|nr:accessory gene regulator B family protein [Paenibacillus humicola]
MLRKLAGNLHHRMIANGVEAPSVDIIVYALNIIGNSVSIIALSLIIGAVTGKFTATLLTLVVFAVIRFLTGGYHLKSGSLCIVVSTIAMSAMPHFHFGSVTIYIFTAISLIMVLIFSPANYDKYARISEKYYPLLKLIAALFVASNFLFVSSILAICFIVQAAMLPFKEGGESE